MTRFPETIKRLRLEHDYTQGKLAELCGLSRQAIAKWEAGINLPDAERLLRLAELFHTTVDELLTGKEPPAAHTGIAAPIKYYSQDEKIVNLALQKAMACSDPDDVVFQFISYIGSRIGCDRIYIFEQNPDKSYKNTYEWCSRGIEPQIEYLQAIPLEDMGAWLRTFSLGKYVSVEDVDALADTDPAVYRWLKPQGIRSIVVLPLFGGRCFLGVDNPAPAFMAQTSTLLEIMAHFAETMLQRRDLDQELRRASLQNDQFIQNSNGVRYELNVITGQLLYDKELAERLGYTLRADTLAQLEEAASAHPEFHDHLMIDGVRRAIDRKENVTVEFMSYKADRSVRWNRLTISPFLDHEGTVLHLYGILQDISSEHRIVEQYNRYVSHLSGGLHVCYLSNPIHLEYASDDLCEFLGYTREEFDALVGNIYINVMAEEDRGAFAAYAMRLAANPGIESCEYRLIKKDGSYVRMIDTMESIDDGSGVRYGYAYVLVKSDMHAMLEMAEDAEKQHLALIDRQYEVLSSLGKDYLNVYRVCLDGDKVDIVQLDGYVTKGMSRQSTESLPYYRTCMQYIQDRVHPDDQQKMLTAMHPDTVRKALTADEDYLVIYRVLDHGETHYYQMKYVRLHRPEDSCYLRFVAGFKNVDKVIEEERRQKEELQSRLNIINAILQVFSFGYYYSRQDNSLTELAGHDKNISKILGTSVNFAEARELMKMHFIDKDACRVINDFIDPLTLDERLGGRRFLSSQVLIRNYGWYEMYMIVTDFDADGKFSHCIITARDITKEKEQEAQYIQSLGLSNRRVQSALQFAYQDTLTGVMNRNAYERDFRAVEGGRKIGLIFCDVNGLKKTNDTEGHVKGDELLRTFAALLKKHFSADCIYRTGGDEFVCMIENIDDIGFTARAQNFRRAAEKCNNIAAVGFSYGDSDRKDALLQEAEAAMYAVKIGGRDSGKPAVS